jgi:hypothetical protein
MTLFEYTSTEGFKEILNFMWDSSLSNEDADAAFERLGYRDQDLGLYSSDFAYWMKVYKNMKNNEYDFLISVDNHLYSQFVVCRSFGEYMDFMKNYLPVLKSINDISRETKKLFAQ